MRMPSSVSCKGSSGAEGAETITSTPSSRSATARLAMKEPTGSPPKRGYACVRKRTRTGGSVAHDRVVASPVAVTQNEGRHISLGAPRESHASVVAVLDGAQRAAGAPPGDELTEWRDVRASGRELAREARVRGGRAGKAQRR